MTHVPAEDDYQGGAAAFERGDDFNPNMSKEWKAGWRDAQADEDRNT